MAQGAFLTSRESSRCQSTYFYQDVQNGASEHKRGFAEDRSPAPLSGAPSAEATQLSAAFMKIGNAKVRKRVLDLVKALASEEQ